MTEIPAVPGAGLGRRLVLRAALRTDVGKVRSENQDFGLLTTPAEERGSRLLIVADGMGGHRGGATASRLAGETIKEDYLTSSADDIAGALRDALRHATTKIFADAQSNPDLRGMGTTTSALAVREGRGWFAHVGDSRIYLIRKGEIQQLTDDHSLVASMVREGLLTSQEAENHPRRNVLQRSMGVGEDVEIDVRGPLELEEGDTFVLCSDGLHGVLKQEEILEVGQMDVEAAADEFVKRALGRGAPDNVTVIVARVERQEFDGDATVIDAEAGLFDETVRESLRAKAEATVEATAPTAPHRHSAAVLKWALLFVVVIVVFGVLLLSR